MTPSQPDGLDDESIALADIEGCFGGAVPAVLATAGADGLPNVTFISRAHRVDDERVALSNQFMSKTARNIAANPRASLLLVDPTTYDEYRFALVYERTERRGHVFERLRADVEAIAALTGMQDVFRLRSADVFRVLAVKRLPAYPTEATGPGPVRDRSGDLRGLAELSAAIGRCTDLETLVDTTLSGLDRLLGFRHSHLMLLDEDGSRLFTIASRGFDQQSIGAEVAVGDGVIGTVAARCEGMRVGNLQQMAKYSRSIRQGYTDAGGVRPGREVPMPGLDGAESRMAVPAMARGELIGVLAVDSEQLVAFNTADQEVLSIVANALASAIEHMRSTASDDDGPPTPPSPARTTPGRTAAPTAPGVTVRFFPIDGSTFLDTDYLIKGVAGRILCSLVSQHADAGRVDFTNKELRLDPSLEMPGFKDNLESRLTLLKRRLEERDAPLRIERTGRGRFRLHVDAPLRLERSDPPAPQ